MFQYQTLHTITARIASSVSQPLCRPDSLHKYPRLPKLVTFTKRCTVKTNLSLNNSKPQSQKDKLFRFLVCTHFFFFFFKKVKDVFLQNEYHNTWKWINFWALWTVNVWSCRKCNLEFFHTSLSLSDKCGVQWRLWSWPFPCYVTNICVILLKPVPFLLLMRLLENVRQVISTLYFQGYIII